MCGETVLLYTVLNCLCVFVIIHFEDMQLIHCEDSSPVWNLQGSELVAVKVRRSVSDVSWLQLKYFK